MTTSPEHTSDESTRWLAAAAAQLDADPGCIHSVFARAHRECGELDADAVRTRLLEMLPSAAERLYQQGDVRERLVVLGSLHLLDVPARRIIEDALRSNDLRLVEAALGPRSAELGDHVWRRAVLKFAYLGIPLASVYGMTDRADSALIGMLEELVRERHSAGRTVAPDVLSYLSSTT